jgi:hypothetical protein
MPSNYQPKYNTANLTPHQIQPKWKHGATKTIRVPVILADRILELAKALDSGELPPAAGIPREAITAILAKVDNKETGYQAKSASRLIKDLRSL